MIKYTREEFVQMTGSQPTFDATAAYDATDRLVRGMLTEPNSRQPMAAMVRLFLLGVAVSKASILAFLGSDVLDVRASQVCFY